MPETVHGCVLVSFVSKQLCRIIVEQMIGYTVMQSRWHEIGESIRGNMNWCFRAQLALADALSCDSLLWACAETLEHMHDLSVCMQGFATTRIHQCRASLLAFRALQLSSCSASCFTFDRLWYERLAVQAHEWARSHSWSNFGRMAQEWGDCRIQIGGNSCRQHPTAHWRLPADVSMCELQVVLQWGHARSYGSGLDAQRPKGGRPEPLHAGQADRSTGLWSEGHPMWGWQGAYRGHLFERHSADGPRGSTGHAYEEHLWRCTSLLGGMWWLYPLGPADGEHCAWRHTRQASWLCGQAAAGKWQRPKQVHGPRQRE